MTDNKIITVRIDVSEYELQLLLSALDSAGLFAWLRSNPEQSRVLDGLSRKVLLNSTETKAAP